MAVDTTQIEEQARRLPAEARARLIQVLMESLQESSSQEIELAWREEIAARLSAYARGELKAISAEEVFAEARQIIS
jgi:putative addiction module component (TIGR02574 family)